ncbi:capsular polysaccharide transport system permease protein [Pseudomonas hunanensis]|uniref:Capsular polysaccharide transport system permease protein n=1 Tax=Pseudomonas hunanensis TaxID=1247546 RepID=A0ACC6K8A8_9PSED|nr:ABC transporter permease [Pseudomonas hunanensis]MDR6714694.1 capsular polysaccharide transport system permease protein [Pseudomonas hunanensis]
MSRHAVIAMASSECRCLKFSIEALKNLPSGRNFCKEMSYILDAYAPEPLTSRALEHGSRRKIPGRNAIGIGPFLKMNPRRALGALLCFAVTILKPRSSLQIQKSVIFALVLREARARFGTRRMGALWTLIEPVCHLLVFSLLWTQIRDRTVADVEYPVFVLIGLAPFLLYRNIALRLMDSLRENRSLFGYKQIKPLDTYVARVMVETCISVTVYSILVFLFAWFGFDMSVHNPLQWVAVLVLGLLFAFGLGMTLALITHALPSIKTFVRLAFFPLFFISGVLIPASYLPQTIMPILLYNPFLHLTELIRIEVLPYYVAVDGISAAYVINWTVVLLFLSLGGYRARRLHLISTKNG